MQKKAVRQVRWLLVLVVAGALGVGVVFALVRPGSVGSRGSLLPFQLVERSVETGLVLSHVSGYAGQRWTIEHPGAGMGLIDYDNDGLLDVYFAQGHHLPGSGREHERVGNRLFRNRGDGTFEEVTETTGCDDPGYAQGVAVGDYNNDGWDDIFLANYGPNALYRNNGDGTFTDVTEQSGINNSPLMKYYPNSCGFFDYDLDGDLDLYVANYSDWQLETHVPSTTDVGIVIYNYPPNLQGQQDIFYRNNGDGTFTEVTREAGLEVQWMVDTHSHRSPRAKGMSLAFTDVNNDGWPDLFVGNDADPQFLFLNNQDGTFTDAARDYGLVRSTDGFYCNMMGVDYGDLNGDRVMDLVASNFQNRPFDVYVSTASGAYQAVADAIEVGPVTRDYLTWGTGLIDFDNDADLDLFITSGHVFDNAEEIERGYKCQPNLLFENRFSEGGTFADVSSLAGPGLALVKWSRTALFGDLDNDGDIDVVVGNLNDRYDILMNEWKGDVPPNNWATFDLRGTISNRDALGTRVYLTAGDLELMGECKATSGYLCAHDRRVHFGLGKHTQVATLEVHWPSGIITTYEDLPANQFLTLTEPDSPPPGTILRRLKPRTAR